MYIENLRLKNFRNYEILNIEFSKNKNIIYGNNAQGKTNIIEAIYFISKGRSQKQIKDKDIIKFKEKEAHINTLINKEKSKIEIDIHLHKDKNKGIAVNKNKIKKLSEYIGIVDVVLFSPEDLNIIKNGPAERRRYLDIEISSINKTYISNIIKYNKILEQRNEQLHKITNEEDEENIEILKVWDEELIKYGTEIIKEREKIINILSTKIKIINNKITNTKEEIEIEYEKNTEQEKYKENIQKNRKKDIKYKTTSVGPHRDDIKIIVNGQDIRIYGSQGQQRTAAITLKLAEVEIIKEIKNENPILLLDDVFSELDEERQKQLVENIKEIQTIITATGIKNNIYNIIKADKIFEVQEGKIKLRK